MRRNALFGFLLLAVVAAVTAPVFAGAQVIAGPAAVTFRTNPDGL